MIGLLIGVYAICGVLAYGLALHELQDGWPGLAWPQRRRDVAAALSMAVIGPVGIVAVLVIWLLDPRVGLGLRYRCLSHDESWAAHQRKWPLLDYREFLRS